MRKIEFIKSAKLPQDFPAGHKPEVAIAGRSNAGKSSLINLLAGGKVVMAFQPVLATSSARGRK
jgi:GTP-binding protein